MPKICVPRIIGGERSHIKEIEGSDDGPTHDTMLDLEVLIDVL